MSAGGDTGEKTEDASPKRKQEAKKNGQVAKSQDLVGATVTVVLIASLPGLVATIGKGFLQAVRSSFANLSTDLSFGRMGQALHDAAMPALPSLLMLLVLAAAIGVVTTVAQTGFNISFKSITPDLKKIDPMSGAKRLFSKKSLMEGAKSLAKFVLFGWIAYGAISQNWEVLGNLSRLPASLALAQVGEIMRGVGLKIAMVWGVVAILDYFFQKKSHDKELKMTKEEVKQEFKESEGSPEVKAARYQRRRQLMKQRVRDAVRTADVVVTNPTHFAVAIKYDPEKHAAPIVVAKGADVLAAKIKEFAKEDRIPIVPNIRLARALYKQCEVGDTVPRELFSAVAEVLAHVYKILGRIKK
jgi:flagellar biosynthetic protein FlhB